MTVIMERVLCIEEMIDVEEYIWAAIEDSDIPDGSDGFPAGVFKITVEFIEDV